MHWQSNNAFAAEIGLQFSAINLFFVYNHLYFVILTFSYFQT